MTTGHEKKEPMILYYEPYLSRGISRLPIFAIINAYDYSIDRYNSKNQALILKL